MFIITKDREIVVNVDNITNIYIENGNRIIARMVDSEDVILGLYADGAKRVFEEMLSKVFPPAALIFQNCMPSEESISAFKEKMDLGAIVISDCAGRAEVKMYDCGVFYMPEE